jgi:Rhodopirellula transposase DDE domain
LFFYIGAKWRGQPLVSLAVIVRLVGSARTAAGLRMGCEVDRGTYPARSHGRPDGFPDKDNDNSITYYRRIYSKDTLGLR